ncbi:E3 ubiquitin-protein ligase RNF14-like [Ceratina calcarata]|uniref:RBR-type E3 ubiquitin transferase n=1 Tax=Ceratina calcarata TaxID=156304 RepID=A0AAJ7IS99_9HYME|nr:E3 ubiquitin-protein ligase RNF14-like [Ceratina calcarata]XP_017875614.1 E3 ubiquitin-protein ligase RNF14-like [Ceratina calcarata]
MDDEKQKDEISALESIYNSEEFSYFKENDQYQCAFTIFINLPEDYHIIYKNLKQPDEPEQKIKLSHLPPLMLHVILPENYPSESPPEFTLYSSWLHLASLIKLCKKLDKLWEENKGQEILFTWMAFLHDEALADVKEKLNMSRPYTYYKEFMEKAHNIQKNKIENVDKEHTTEAGKNSTRVGVNVKRLCRRSLAQKHQDKRAVLNYPIGRNPIQALIDYNEKRNQIEFKKNFYTCRICFLDKIGEHCTQFLPCGHVFCKDCVTGYLEVRIKDGNVQNISCPEEKCTSETTPAQIKDLVSSELFAKYDSILLSATLDTMGDIVYCPRRSCQYPVSREPNEQMANCPICQYAFCVYCKSVYHGIEPCKIYSDEVQKIVAEYQEASKESKLHMELRYGKKQLQNLVENALSENWIKTNSHKCPKCQLSIEKMDGCNKMVCWRCKTFFCWLCKTILDRDKPYRHFQDMNSHCYNRLFHGVVIEDDEDDGDDNNDEVEMHILRYEEDRARYYEMYDYDMNDII